MISWFVYLKKNIYNQQESGDNNDDGEKALDANSIWTLRLENRHVVVEQTYMTPAELYV